MDSLQHVPDAPKRGRFMQRGLAFWSDFISSRPSLNHSDVWPKICDYLAMGISIANSPAQHNDAAAPLPMTEQKVTRSANSARHFISGLGSGVTSAVLLQPLDLLKTRVQQSGSSSLGATIRDLRKSSSLMQSLWRGTVPSALRTGFGSALYFTSLNAIRQHAHQTGILGRRLQTQGRSSALPSLTNSGNLISGAVARTLAGFVLMPLTVIKVRFESSLYTYPSIMSAAADIRRAHGWRGFFSGFGATAFRDAPYAGMYVLFYEMLKSRLGSLASKPVVSGNGPTRMQATLASSVNFTSAMLAGAACSIVSNPFDAVKTRIQLQPLEYRNIWQAWYKMVTQEGIRSLWDGLALRMSRKALSSALAWTVYEELIRRAGAGAGAGAK